jgi:hypothetical protein
MILRLRIVDEVHFKYFTSINFDASNLILFSHLSLIHSGPHLLSIYQYHFVDVSDEFDVNDWKPIELIRPQKAEASIETSISKENHSA